MTTGLKLGPLADEKPVKLTVELPAALFRDLTAYGEILGRVDSSAGDAVEPARLIVPMLQRFIATDRGFSKARRSSRSKFDE
jgi:hypothetical protein